MVVRLVQQTAALSDVVVVGMEKQAGLTYQCQSTIFKRY
jgi:hypothetical protein